MLKKFKKIIFILIIFICIYIGKVNAFTIVLDPGHGGSDAGAVNKSAGLKESVINYKIASYLSAYLNKYEDVNVLITRSKNEYVSLKNRVDVALNNNADLFLCLHIDSAESSKARGATTYITYKNNLDKYNKNCKELSNLILNNLSKLGIKNNGAKTRIIYKDGAEWHYADGSRADYYAVIRYCMKGTSGNGAKYELDIAAGESIPAILVEHCYIKNGDEKFVKTNSAIAKLAKADLMGIVEYYNLKLKENESLDDIIIEEDLKKVKIKSLKNIKTKKAQINWYKDNIADGYQIYMTEATINSKEMKTKNKLKLRKKCSTKSKALKTIQKGTKIQILKKNAKKAGGYTWYKVQYNDEKGYVASKYLENIHNVGVYKKVTTIGSNKTTSYTKTKLSKNKVYNFKVRSYKKTKNSTQYGEYSTAKTIKITK